MSNNYYDNCKQCGIMHNDINNLKKDIEDMRIDMKVFQRTNQEIELKFAKLEVLFTEKFLHLQSTLEELVEKMKETKQDKKTHKFVFLSQFVYPGTIGLFLAYIAWKISK